MTIGLNGTLSVGLRFSASNADEISTPVDSVKANYERMFNSTASSTISFEANQLYRARRTVTLATQTDDIDLYGLLENVFGEAVNFIKVHFVLVVNRSTETGDDILVGGAGAGNNAWGAPFNGDQDAQLTVGPNSPSILANIEDGFAVTAGSQDVLRLEHDGVSAEIDYDLYIVGTQL